MIFPNFFIIGAPKSGTSALAHYLAEHPEVYFTQPKELFYWSEDHPIARTRHNVYSIDDYMKYFDGCDPQQHKAIGEGSTNYLQSRTAVANIMKFNPHSRFIVLLRNPVEAAYGMHGELMKHYFEDEPDFEKAWQLQKTRSEGHQIPARCVMVNQLQYRDVINYVDQLNRFFALVPAGQRRVFLFDEFASNTQSVYQQCLQFLGLEEDGRKEFPRMNPSRQYRSGLIGKLYQSPPEWIEPTMKRFRAWYASQPENVRRWVGQTMSRTAPRSKLNPEFEQQLKELLLPDVEQLEHLLGIDLSTWKPASIGVH